MNNGKSKILTFPLRLCIPILIISYWIKVMHWPYGKEIMVATLGAIIILYSFRFAYKSVKKYLDYIKLILIVSYSLSGIVTILHFPFRFPLQMIATTSLLIWLGVEGTNYLSRKENDVTDEHAEDPTKKYTLMSLKVAAAILVISGAVFKIVHWPGAIYLILTGLALGVLWFIVDSIWSKE